MASKKGNNNESTFNDGSLLLKTIEILDKVFDDYLSDFPRYAELKTFMENQDNLYTRKDGKILVTSEYRVWMAEIEQYMKEQRFKGHSISKHFAEMHENDKVWKSLIRGIEDFVNTNGKLKKEYEEASEKRGFNPEKWMFEQIRKSSSTEEEAKEKLDAIRNRIYDDVENLLKNNVDLQHEINKETEKYGTE